MLETIKMHVADGKMVAIYSGPDHDKFSVGVIRGASEDYTLIKSYSKAGAFDGHLLIRTDLVYLIETNSKYLKKNCEA